MRPQLRDYAAPAITDFIRRKVEESGGNGVVIGLSGGIDSAVVSKLCADAAGPEKVLNIFMPSEVSPARDRQDVGSFCDRFGMELKTVDIGPAVKAFSSMLPHMDRCEHAGNVAARVRMIVLYHYARALGRVVMGTGNKSELLIGYFTKFGDGGSDFAPIGDLYKTEVRQLAEQIGVPREFIDKVPSAGLWAGQTDEEDLGIAYGDLDQILYGLERSQSDKEIAAETGIDLVKVRQVLSRHRGSVHKRKLTLIPKLGVRTIGLDWRE